MSQTLVASEYIKTCEEIVKTKTILFKSDIEIFNDIATRLSKILLLLEFEGKEYIKVINLTPLVCSDIEVVGDAIVYYAEHTDKSKKLVIQKITDIPSHGETPLSKGWVPIEEYKNEGYIGVIDPTPLLEAALRLATGEKLDEFIEFIKQFKSKMVTNQRAIHFLQF